MKPVIGAICLALAASVTSAAHGQDAASATTRIAEDWRADALSLEAEINRIYAYRERLPGGDYRLPEQLREEAEAVSDARSLLRFTERALLVLADHHAITGSSFADSWAIVPSYADLWIEAEGEVFRITSVRRGSPAELAGIRAGETLEAVNGVPLAEAVDEFWRDLGVASGGPNNAFAARVLAAGRRNVPRHLTIGSEGGGRRELSLPNLYQVGVERSGGPVRAEVIEGALHITINDALGDTATIAAFDQAMASAAPEQPVVLDLRDTPGGGNTTVARAIMGWFAAEPTPYQRHALPMEERETGIPREWLELVLPRENMRHSGPVTVPVGRWTGSMGEGLALGMRELGACVEGEPMAGLLGAIGDFTVGQSELVFKLPFERLSSVAGQPREQFAPVADCAQPAPVLHYLRTNSDGSEAERVVVWAESPESVHVFKGRDRCTNAAYVTARLDPRTGQAISLVGGRLGRDLEQQPFAWFTNPPGRAQARLGSPSADPVFDLAVGPRWFVYDFDFADMTAHPPAAIREGRDWRSDMLLVLTGEGAPSFTNRGDFTLTYGGRGTGAQGEYLFYRAGGAALDGGEGAMWFDAADGRLLAARLPIANHAEYSDFAFTLVRREEGEAAWRAVLADHWRGCAPAG